MSGRGSAALQSSCRWTVFGLLDNFNLILNRSPSGAVIKQSPYFTLVLQQWQINGQDAMPLVPTLA